MPRDLEKKRATWRAWYRRNRGLETKRINARRKIRRRKACELLREIKRNGHCQKCGFDHPAALQFHHRRASDKRFDVSQASTGNYSMTAIQREIAKCVLICANCHFILHYNKRQKARK